MLAMETVVTRNEECPVREIGQGLVIVAPRGEVTHSLEEIGAFIWKRIDGQKTLKAILEDLLAEYNVAEDTASRDLQSFVNDLLEAELLVPA